MKTEYTKYEEISPTAFVSQVLQEFILQVAGFGAAEIKNSQLSFLEFSVGRRSFASSWCVLCVLLCASVCLD